MCTGLIGRSRDRTRLRSPQTNAHRECALETQANARTQPPEPRHSKSTQRLSPVVVAARRPHSGTLETWRWAEGSRWTRRTVPPNLRVHSHVKYTRKQNREHSVWESHEENQPARPTDLKRIRRRAGRATWRWRSMRVQWAHRLLLAARHGCRRVKTQKHNQRVRLQLCCSTASTARSARVRSDSLPKGCPRCRRKRRGHFHLLRDTRAAASGSRACNREEPIHYRLNTWLVTALQYGTWSARYESI